MKHIFLVGNSSKCLSFQKVWAKIISQCLSYLKIKKREKKRSISLYFLGYFLEATTIITRESYGYEMVFLKSKLTKSK